MKICHIILNEKFTSGYINFMKSYMSEYNHFFLVMDSLGVKRQFDEDNVKYCVSCWEVAFSPKVRKYLEEAEKIIVSGLFSIERGMFFWPKHIFDKVYLQYWGGDFYQLRDRIFVQNRMDFERMIWRKMLISCFKRSYGAIFLINGEYEKYKEITGIRKEHVFVAVMPYDPNRMFPFNKYRKIERNENVKVVVGNSATATNKHEDVFKLLCKFSKCDMDIYCPLSYGDEEVRKSVSEMGIQMFGNKFHPIYEWMSEEEYFRFLSTCNIGVFGSDRQQGMGNIRAMLCMGKKLYIRSGTSMFENYIRQGFTIFDINELETESFDDFVSFSEKEANERIADEWDTPVGMREQWKKIFESNVSK